MSDEKAKQHDAFVPPLPRGDKNENPPDIGFLDLIAEDFRTHDRSLLEPGFWAIAVHRFGNWRMGLRSKPLRVPATVAYRTLRTAVHWGWGIKLDYTVKLGRRVRIWHHGGMVLGARSIGDDVHIRQNTTFGIPRRTDLNAKPIIGDRVDIGCGAVVLGHIEVGADSVIGANTVVIRDVPPNSLVVGNPGRVVKSYAPPPPNKRLVESDPPLPADNGKTSNADTTIWADGKPTAPWRA